MILWLYLKHSIQNITLNLVSLRIITQRCINFVSRSNFEIRSRGTLSEAHYQKREKRSIISLQMCFMGWLYELISIASLLLTPVMINNGVPNIYYADAIMMFVVIPVVHLMNDEETKQIIYERNWYQGFRHMLGLYREPEVKRSTQPVSPTKSSINRITPNEPKSKVTLLSPKPISICRRHSSLGLISSQDVMMAKKEAIGQKRNSLSELFLIQQICSYKMT